MSKYVGYIMGPIGKLQCRSCGILLSMRQVNPKKEAICSNCGDTGLPTIEKEKSK